MIFNSFQDFTDYLSKHIQKKMESGVQEATTLMHTKVREEYLSDDKLSLAEDTVQRRLEAGFDSGPPLVASGQLLDSVNQTQETEKVGKTILVTGEVFITPGNHYYSDKSEHYGDTIDMVDLAVLHELGTSKVPARPVWKPVKDKNEEAAVALVENAFTDLS